VELKTTKRAGHCTNGESGQIKYPENGEKEILDTRRKRGRKIHYEYL
jgi:hypothetical protein